MMKRKSKVTKAERLVQFFEANKNNYRLKVEFIKDAARAVGTCKDYARSIYETWMLKDMTCIDPPTHETTWVPKCNGRVSQKFYFDDSRLFER